MRSFHTKHLIFSCQQNKSTFYANLITPKPLNPFPADNPNSHLDTNAKITPAIPLPLATLSPKYQASEHQNLSSGEVFSKIQYLGVIHSCDQETARTSFRNAPSSIPSKYSSKTTAWSKLGRSKDAMLLTMTRLSVTCILKVYYIASCCTNT